MTTLTLADLADRLDYYQVRFWINNYQEDSGRTGAGEDIAADMSDPVWLGEITIDPNLTHAQAADAQARIEELDGVIGRFYMYDPRLPYPIGDPLGTIINAFGGTIKIADISSDRTRLKFKNGPPLYWLNFGDRFHCEFGSDPVHRAYHRIITRIRFDADGNTGWITVRPRLKAGIVINDVVELRQPSPLWRLKAGGFEPGSGQGQLTPGGSLSLVQVL